LKTELIDILKCIECDSETLNLDAKKGDKNNIYEGKLVCLKCSKGYPIKNGILNTTPPEYKVTSQNDSLKFWKKSQERFEKRTFEMLEEAEGCGVYNLNYYQSFFSFANISGKVLEIGTGMLLKQIHEKDKRLPIDYENLQYYGIDPFIPFAEYKDYLFVQAVGEELPIRNDIFDNVIISSTLDHSHSPEKVIKEAYRVLKKSGYIYIGSIVHDKEFIEKQITKTLPFLKHLMRLNKKRIAEFLSFKKRKSFYHPNPLTLYQILDMMSESGFEILRVTPSGYFEGRKQ